MGHIALPSYQDHRNVLTFIEDHRRNYITIPLALRSHAPAIITKHFQKIQTQHGRSIQKFHTDNAPEYKTKTATTSLTSHGIHKTTTIPYHLQLNGIVERLNRTLSDAGRCALSYSRLPSTMWHLQMLYATFKYNTGTHSKKTSLQPNYGTNNGKYPHLCLH